MRTAAASVAVYWGVYSGVVGEVSATPPLDRQTLVKILPCPKLRLRAVEKKLNTKKQKQLFHFTQRQKTLLFTYIFLRL